jgi:MFS family permease
VGSLSGVFKSGNGLRLTDPKLPVPPPSILPGGVRALFFGYLTDRLGRRKLFLITLAIYSIATLSAAVEAGYLLELI